MLKKGIFIIYLVFCYVKVSAQQKEEQAIRQMEQQEMQALLKGDTLTLFEKIWSPALLVQNPANLIVTRQEIAALIKAGKIDYAAFERIIEKINIVGNTALVMGREEVAPEGNTDHSGKVVIRRFTNIWIKHYNQWKLVGRQATITSIE